MIKRMGISVTTADLKGLLKELHKIFFSDWEEISNFFGFAGLLESLADLLLKKSFLDRYPLNLKILEKIYAISDEFANASFVGEHFDREEIFKIFKDTIENQMVSFSGSPLKGLQILGLLETRFGNV